MRKLLVLALITIAAVAASGCRSDAHRQYTYRMMQRSCLVDSYGIVDDIHQHILMTDRPTHLTNFVE
jgi:hypothetical protein